MGEWKFSDGIKVDRNSPENVFPFFLYEILVFRHKPPPVATSYLITIIVLHIQCATSNCDVCCVKCQSDWKQNCLLNPLPSLVLYCTVFQVRIIKSSECNPFPAKIFLVQSQQWNTRRKCEKHQNDVIEHISHLFLI